MSIWQNCSTCGGQKTECFGCGRCHSCDALEMGSLYAEIKDKNEVILKLEARIQWLS